MMFKNCVFKVSVDTKKWIKKAGIRAVKTVAQTFIATIGSIHADILELSIGSWLCQHPY